METRIYQNEEVEHGHADKSEFERTWDKISELSSWAQRSPVFTTPSEPRQKIVM